MTIDPLHFDGCPTHEPTRQLLRTVVKEQAIAANLREIKVTTEAQAKELKFPGSPTIRVNGKDIDEGHEGAYGLKLDELLGRHTGETLWAGAKRRLQRRPGTWCHSAKCCRNDDFWKVQRDRVTEQCAN